MKKVHGQWLLLWAIFSQAFVGCTSLPIQDDHQIDRLAFDPFPWEADQPNQSIYRWASNLNNAPLTARIHHRGTDEIRIVLLIHGSADAGWAYVATALQQFAEKRPHAFMRGSLDEHLATVESVVVCYPQQMRAAFLALAQQFDRAQLQTPPFAALGINLATIYHLASRIEGASYNGPTRIVTALWNDNRFGWQFTKIVRQSPSDDRRAVIDGR